MKRRRFVFTAVRLVSRLPWHSRPPRLGRPSYYTLDGSEPTSASTLYTGPSVLLVSAEVKARAFCSGYNASDVTAFPSQSLQEDHASPMFSRFS